MRLSSEFVVNLKLLEDNYLKLKKLAPNNKIVFMVKADAYGHGLESIVKFSNEKLKIDIFGCASLGEAQLIKSLLPSDEVKVWVFSDLELEGQSDCYVDTNIYPVLSNLSQLKFIISNKLKIPLLLKLNTGMNRLGINEEDYEDAIQLLKENNCKLMHLMTHFSHSFFKIKNGDKCHRQYNKFLNFKKRLDQEQVLVESTSVSNSGAIEQQFGLDESHIRPGLMLYGPRSVGSYKKEDGLWSGKVISSLKTEIFHTETIKKGTPVGYGGHTCNADGIIAYIPIGYGDGILTYYSGVKVSHNGAIGKIIGRVNMDMTGIHFNNSDAHKIKVGGEVEIWNHSEDSIVEFSNQVKSIPYQVFTSITQRVPKRYIYE